MLDRNILPMLSAIARSAGSINSAEYKTDLFTSVSITVDLQSISGAPTTTTLDVVVQYSPDQDGSRWFNVPDTQLQLTATGQMQIIGIDLGAARRARVAATLSFSGGTTPTATYAVDMSLTKQSMRYTQRMSMTDRLDPVNDSVTAYPLGHNTTVISTATTTTIKNGPGVVRSIRVVGGTLGNVTAYDNTAGSGTLLVPTVTPAAGQELLTDAGFVTGLTIVTAAATLIVITWR